MKTLNPVSAVHAMVDGFVGSAVRGNAYLRPRLRIEDVVCRAIKNRLRQRIYHFVNPAIRSYENPKSKANPHER